MRYAILLVLLATYQCSVIAQKSEMNSQIAQEDGQECISNILAFVGVLDEQVKVVRASRVKTTVSDNKEMVILGKKVLDQCKVSSNSRIYSQ